MLCSPGPVVGQTADIEQLPDKDPPESSPESAPSEEAPPEVQSEPPEEEASEEEEPDESPDALHDPLIHKFIKRRQLIDRPGFSLETGGKIQVQYYDAASDDPDNEDDLFLRRFRPLFLGHLGASWTWKFEVEIGADITSGGIDTDQLDIRDIYFRYQGFKTDGRRLTLGNQKAPFSRDFMTPSVHQLLVERTFVGDSNVGVPTRVAGIHFRDEARDGKLVYWGSTGYIGHVPGVDAIKFDSLVRARSELNEGPLVSARLDLHPRGEMTFADGDNHTPKLEYTWSLAGYSWNNDGRNNTFTQDGVGIAAEKADLDSATGLEVSGGLRGRGITLDWQYNRIRGETVADGFTGGLYVDGTTHLDVAAVEGGYWLPGTLVELGGALSRIDADGYAHSGKRHGVVLNLHGSERFNTKLQVSHDWIFNRKGVDSQDFQETRLQIQYVW
jgi:hypothetical protein